MGLAYYLVLIMAVTNSNLVSCIASHWILIFLLKMEINHLLY